MRCSVVCVGMITEDQQDTIKDYSLTVYYFDGITDDEITEMFYRLNNGKPLSSIELTRVKANSIERIKTIGKHELFTSTLTEKAINKYTNEDIVIKSWALLNAENPSFDTKYIRPLMENADITEQQQEQIIKAYDRILKVYTDITSIGNKESNKIAKRVITRTHLLSLIPVTLKSIEDNITVEDFTKFTTYFFNGKKSSSISDIYNTASGSASGKSDNVNKRITEITKAYNDYFKKSKLESNTNAEIPKKEIKKIETALDDDWQESYMPHEVSNSFYGQY